MTALSLAYRFVGLKEISGAESNPLVLAMLRLDNEWPQGDDVPWCSAFASFVCWLMGLPRSTSLAARSWLTVGTPVELAAAVPGSDVVVLKRGSSETAGHVGFYVGREGESVLVLGGNQSDAVTVARFPVADVLGVRRLA